MMRFFLSCREVQLPDAALLLMMQLNQFQWWFLHEELLEHLNGCFFNSPPLPPPEINYSAGPLPPCFSWMPLRSQLDLTHDSNQSCLQLRSEYVLRITDWSVESGKTQKRTERHHMCRGWKIDTQHLESEVWGWGGGFASSFAWGGQRQLRIWASGALWGC